MIIKMMNMSFICIFTIILLLLYSCTLQLPSLPYPKKQYWLLHCSFQILFQCFIKSYLPNFPYHKSLDYLCDTLSISIVQVVEHPSPHPQDTSYVCTFVTLESMSVGLAFCVTQGNNMYVQLQLIMISNCNIQLNAC